MTNKKVFYGRAKRGSVKNVPATELPCNMCGTQPRFAKKKAQCRKCYLAWDSVLHPTEQSRARTREWYKRRGKLLRVCRQYGLAEAAYKKLLLESKGKCKICLCTPEILHIDHDHDHKTNKVRGLICAPCNRGIGYFKDNPQFLRNAAKYLETSPALTSMIEHTTE